MKVIPLDIAILVWGLLGTFALKLLLRSTGNDVTGRVVVFGAAIAFMAVPLLALRSEVAEYSAFGVVAAGVAFFWFAILAGRKGNAT